VQRRSSQTVGCPAGCQVDRRASRCHSPGATTPIYSAISNNMKKLVHWPLMGGLLHLVQRGGDWAGPQPAQAPPRCTKLTAHPSTASVPIIVLLYNGRLLCGFNVPIKGLNLKVKDLCICLNKGLNDSNNMAACAESFTRCLIQTNHSIN